MAGLAALGVAAGWVEHQPFMGDFLYRAVRAASMAVDAVHRSIAQTEPFTAIVHVILVLVTGHTVGVVLGGRLLGMGGGNGGGEGQ